VPSPEAARDGTRLLLARDAFALARDEVVAALAPAVTRLEALCGAATPVTVSDGVSVAETAGGLRGWFEVFRTLQHGEIRDAHEAWVRDTSPTFGPQIGARFAIVMRTDPADVARMQPVRAAIRAHLDALLADGGVFVLPTVPDIAPLCNLPPDETISVRERALALLCIAGLGGLPQLSMPVATVDGCPVGLSLIGARGRDAQLLALAEAFSAG